ncbi:MAG: hypothetical protein WAX77_15965 [Methylococcaceae bacterium]
MSFLLKCLSLLIGFVLLIGNIVGAGCFIALLIYKNLDKLSISIIAIGLIAVLALSISYWLIQFLWKTLNSTSLYRNLNLSKGTLLLCSFLCLLISEILFLNFLFAKIAARSASQHFTSTALNSTLIFSLGALLYLSIHSIIDNTAISKKVALYDIFSLNGIVSLFLKAVGLLIGFLLLVGGGGCFAVIVVAGLFNPIESLKQLFSSGWVVLIPFCIGVFGWILIEKVLEKPSENIYIDELEDDKE